MRTTAHAAAFAFALSLAGCQRQGTADTAPAEETSALVDRAWTRSDSTELPGILRIFLSDGTLVMDSCWETYRLSRWRKESDTALVWREDTAEIRAEIVSLSADELVLRLALTGGEEEQRYRPAPVPYVCPDMPR